MLVKKDSKITEVQLADGTLLAIGDVHGDGTIFEIEAGTDFENEIKDWDFEDWDGNLVPASEVKIRLDVLDRGEGWSVFLTDDGTEVIEC
jgi:hypothetical protein